MAKANRKFFELRNGLKAVDFRNKDYYDRIDDHERSLYSPYMLMRYASSISSKDKFYVEHYIEMVKARAYGIDFSDEERDGAIFTLHKTLETILKLLAPITPFITEHLWKILYSNESIHKQKQVNVENIEEQTEITKEISEFNSKVWNEKKSQNLSLKDSIKIEIPEILQPFKKDLKSMHNLID